MSVAVVAALAVMSLIGAAPAGAGGDSCYPDGCSPATNPPAGEEVSCGMSLATAQSGDRVTATVANVPDGALVRLFFDGDEVAADRAAEASADVELSFTLPDKAPGTYAVVAVGDDFSATCGHADGNTGVEVLGASVGRGGDGDASGNGGGDGAAGVLAFTGGQLLLLVAAALALVVLGGFIVAASRRRRALR